MSNLHLLLRIFTVIVFPIVILFLDQYYLFWLLWFYVFLLTIVDKNFISLLLEFAIILILLFCLYTSKIRIILKVLFIGDFLLKFFLSFSKKERKNIHYRAFYRDGAKTRKKMFYQYYQPKILKWNEEKAEKIYSEVSLSDKVNHDLEDKYLLGRIRYYGYSNKISHFVDRRFTWYDFVFLLLEIVLFIILFIYW